MADKKYVEVRFKVLIEDFEPYEAEAKEFQDQHGTETSGTARIKAEVIKQAKIKREARRKPSVLDVFDECKIIEY
ncbi:hypothetical protein QFZ31_006392 [Neobacillus niacini]|uniref:hypothetical protein n=1 Tax=Neobacillus driksii TaxID=3035913 RepID=UPI002783477B|nr:hypothetical protein [Neobacillus niacini]MDQ0976514.1 hypothetical protein [Neobacillus niacini]